MELVSQEAKAEMEECKREARAAGLAFDDNTLEFIVTNQDMLELSPKVMIPSLYDYWVHDVEVIRNKWMYDAFPHNPYETVINTRPPISFYNQDNADWFNVMIFYHVLGHIDLYQNNVFFRKTWDDDFYGQALADKRLVNRTREELGAQKRWVDYVIEFALQIDNLVGYHKELEASSIEDMPEMFGIFSPKIDFYFGQFFMARQEERTVDTRFYYEELERYNECVRQHGKQKGEIVFFEDNRFRSKFPEFHADFRRWKEKEQKPQPKDLFEFLFEHSDVLNREKNLWMKDVISVIRRTSIYFQPQMRTKICHEGWASFWHERLYGQDQKQRIHSHEVDYAKVNAGVTAIPQFGINPYATGKLLFEFIEELGRKGKLSREYQLLRDVDERKNYDRHLGDSAGKEALFQARTYLNDYLLINFLSDKDFQDFVDKNKLWIAGVRPSRTRWDMAEVYIKTKSGAEYRKRLNKMLYHPPDIRFSAIQDQFKIGKPDQVDNGHLFLEHVYEGRSLHTRFIPGVLMGLEFFWGNPVHLQTTEYEWVQPTDWWEWWRQERFNPKFKKVTVLYSCKDRKTTRHVIEMHTPPVSKDEI